MCVCVSVGHLTNESIRYGSKRNSVSIEARVVSHHTISIPPSGLGASFTVSLTRQHTHTLSLEA